MRLRRLAAVALAVVVLTAAPAGADLPVPDHDPDAVRQQADDIVGRAEFRRPEPSLLDRARTWAEDQFNRILAEALSGSAGSVIGWLVLVIAIVAAVWFGTRFGRTVQPGAHQGVRVEGVHRRSPADWRAEAEAQEAEGAWKLALRSRYRALVGDLVATGVLEEVAGRTTGEYRRDVAQRAPGLAGSFGAATELFELAWYADRRTGPEENAEFRRRVDEITGVRA